MTSSNQGPDKDFSIESKKNAYKSKKRVRLRSTLRRSCVQ